MAAQHLCGVYEEHPTPTPTPNPNPLLGLCDHSTTTLVCLPDGLHQAQLYALERARSHACMHACMVLALAHPATRPPACLPAAQDVALWRRLAAMSTEAGFFRQAIYCLCKVVQRVRDDLDAQWDRAVLYAEIGETRRWGCRLCALCGACCGCFACCGCCGCCGCCAIPS
jgi:hypothetical protein